ncbi:MAG: hypothetical protein KDE51_20970 [Anaerolineales bacterium]|nr:hypothetical protein [Anaerolineales bacterium]
MKTTSLLRDYLNNLPPFLQHTYTIYEWPDLPDPWLQVQAPSVSEFIGRWWAPIQHHLPQTVSRLQAQCDTILAVEADGEPWALVYVLSLLPTNDYGFLFGYAPTTNPQLRFEVTQQGWLTPSGLADFYQVHNGIGEPLIPLVNGARELTLLSEHFPANERPFLDYEPTELLEFAPDGGGNGQYFYKRLADGRTVDWDHETRELSDEMPFWAFVDQRLSQLWSNSGKSSAESASVNLLDLWDQEHGA